jgi:hypothetical protein
MKQKKDIEDTNKKKTSAQSNIKTTKMLIISNKRFWSNILFSLYRNKNFHFGKTHGV